MSDYYLLDNYIEIISLANIANGVCEMADLSVELIHLDITPQITIMNSFRLM